MTRLLLASLGLALLGAPARAATITVTPADSYTKIEAAQAGDVVLIAPGTYTFRVMLDKQGSLAQPITLRAQDPTNRPVWDLGGKPVSQWPGSYGAGDKGRGCWQVKGSHYLIEGIVFRNCQDVSSAGIRAVDSGPLTVRDCLFEDNTNGLTGSAEGFVVEFCEFRKNGKLTASGSPTHNVYIYGGTFALRHSYLHDPLEGQNIHLRARQATVEYNWLARSASYPADLMSCNTLCGGSGTSPITQKLTLRGNIILQHTSGNLSQIVALFNDEPSGSYDGSGAVSAMELTLINNTVMGVPLAAGKTQRLVNMRNDGVDTKVVLHNNIIHQLKELAVPHDAAKSNWWVSGKNNWVSSGTPTTGLTASVVGASPGFASATDYRLAAGSPCVGQAAAVIGLPDREYYLDEVITLQYRPRLTAKDIGAHEQGNTSPPVGPYGTPPPPPDAGGITDAAPPGDGPVATGDGPVVDGAPTVTDGGTGDGTAAGDATGRGEDGCSCRVTRRPAPALWLVLVGLAALIWSRRRR